MDVFLPTLVQKNARYISAEENKKETKTATRKTYLFAVMQGNKQLLTMLLEIGGSVGRRP